MDLFKETIIGGIKAKNHFVRSATAEGKATEAGAPTEQIKQVYIDLAKNEVGTIITSLTAVASYERCAPGQMAIDNDDLIPAYKDIADAVHAEGSTIILQLVHGSSKSQVSPETAKILGPSAIPHPVTGWVPKEMTKEDISDVIQLFVDASLRAKKAGYDGVQLHAAHGGLVGQFLVDTFNRRTDEYGGSRENRFRFLKEIYLAVRAAVGDDYPIWMKIDTTDDYEDGMTMDDYLWYSEELVKLGLDAVETSGENPMKWPGGCYYREAGEKLAERVDATVILTGGVRTLEEMNEIAAAGKINVFGMSRPFMGHPDYLMKLKNAQ